MLSIEHWLDRDKPGKRRRGQIKQRGAGWFVLCAQCNNRTGRLYVPELEKWSRAGAQLVNQLPDDDDDPEPKMVSFGLRPVQPLRFVKQFVTMILAINGGEFRKRNQGLADFVLDPQTTGLPGQYQLYLILYRGPKSRHAGVSGRLDTETGALHTMSEVAHPPFAYAMAFDEQTPLLPAGNISRLADYGWEETAEIRLDLMVGSGHTILPTDYRSAAAVAQEVEQNRRDRGAADD
jgi:hypothetical protein